MSSGVSALLQIGERTLFNNAQSIRIAGANIANVDAPGYSRRKPTITFERTTQMGAAANFGSGATISNVKRMTDQFLNKELLGRISDRASSESRDSLWTKVEEFFPLDGRGGIISTEMNNFTSALQDLAESPSDDSLRQRVVFAGSSLTDSINRTFKGIAGVQREGDNQIGYLVDDMNRLTGEIADLNSRISASEVAGQDNLSLRDSRDQTLRELAQFVSFDTVEQNDGTVTVSLSNGFALVNAGNARKIEFLDSPSFQPVGGYPPGMDGNPLRHLVFNFGDSTTRSDFDLTDIIAAGKGELSGLLSLRGTQAISDTSTFDTQGSLIDVAARVESVARHLLERFNESYMGNLADPNAPAVDMTGANPGPYALFSGATDDNANSLPDDLDPNVAYALRIGFGVQTPEKFAAAWDLDPGVGTSFGTGDAANIQQLLDMTKEVRNYNLGDFSANLRINGLIDETTSKVGSEKARSAADLEFDKDRETVVSELQASMSGVNLDEEFTKLINLQRQFQGASRLVKIGDELLASIVSILG